MNLLFCCIRDFFRILIIYIFWYSMQGNSRRLEPNRLEFYGRFGPKPSINVYGWFEKKPFVIVKPSANLNPDPFS